MTRQGTASRDLPPSLPPVEVRKSAFIVPEQSIETPLTPIGLVDRKRLIKLVNATLNSAYKWPSEKDDEHHLLWPNAWYPSMPDAPVNPHVFRNLPLNKVDLPRTFHNWAHRVTAPPPVPTMEVMDLANQAQDCIDEMALAMRIGMQLVRNKRVSHERFSDRMEELFDQYHDSLRTIKSLPEEFHFIDPQKYDVTNVIDMLEIRGEIGRLASKATVATATRIIRQSTFAA